MIEERHDVRPAHRPSNYPCRITKELSRKRKLLFCCLNLFSDIGTRPIPPLFFGVNGRSPLCFRPSGACSAGCIFRTESLFRGLVLFRARLVLASKAAKNRKEDDVIVFSLSTENAAGTGGGTEEAALRDKIAGRDQNGAKGAAGQDIQKYCLIAV